ncbi:RNA polymerase [denestis virus]|uniref:RNA-directed RNA polymerase L n=1 Tax=denestis virus TaxID=2940992 RepID=A0AAE9HT86_9MONO|nr:RNA polymerase [denestis virus]
MDFLEDTILYPESHLNSPLVAQKLVTYIEYSCLPHNQELKDKTILKTITEKIQNYGHPHHLKILYQSGRLISPWVHPKGKCLHVPYPECNKSLFRYVDHKLTRKIDRVLAHANTAYNSVSERIYSCLKDIREKLGGSFNQDELINGNDSTKILDLPEIMISSQWYDPFLFWFTIKTEMRSCVKDYANTKGRNQEKPMILKSDDSFIVINRLLVYIVDLKSLDAYYLTFEMVLMMCDVVEGRLMCEVAMICDSKYIPLLPNVKSLWVLIDGFFPDLGNNTYNIVSLLEPLTLGFLQLLDEAPILAGAFLDHCFTELVAELNDNGYTSQADQQETLRIIREIFNISNVHLLAEMFSFFRSFGHPLLEAEEAADKVRIHMHKPKVISFEVLMKGHAIFCATIINGYRDRHGGAWPPLTLPDHATSSIRMAQINNEAITDALAVSHWKSFCGIQFSCFMPLSLDEDLTMYMKDKALAAISKEWDSPYVYDVMRYRPPKQTTSRRLIDVFINDPKFDPYNMINYVLSGEYLTDKDFNLSYSLKEKETKKVGRLFAKMSYKMRACQVIAESLISNGVGKYFKDNGMAKDEHDLTKTLHKLSISSVPKDHRLFHMTHSDFLTSTTRVAPHLASSDNSLLAKDKINEYPSINPGHNSQPKDQKDSDQYETISTFLTTDLQKFCLNWRAETINIFAERLNEIYGLPGFFQWLHKRLEISTLYVCDPYCPPKNDYHVNISDQPDEHIFIKNPMGGIEGFCQKLWTISTIPFLYLSAYETGVRISSVVQGDNEAIAITKKVPSTYPYWLKKQESAETARIYFKRLRYNFGMIGHNLKANETLISSHFFVYSKQIYYDGVILSQALKSVSRCVFWSETIVDETRSACSNIATTIAKAIEKGYSRDIGYSLCILKTFQQIVISLDYTINPYMTAEVRNPIMGSPNWFIHATLTPAPLGGFNYLNMSRIYVRNIGDPITASLADVKRMINAKMLDRGMLQKIMNQPPGDSTYLDWANDPYSSNIPNTQSITKMIKNITARNILIHSPNPMLKGLFHTGSIDEDHKLASFLMDRKVIIPRAAHEILDNSIPGAREHIAGMLDTTKGLIRSGLKVGGLRSRLISKIATYDVEQFRRFNQLVLVRQRNELIELTACSVALAKTLRQHMWAHLAKGRIIYGLEVPDILEAMIGDFISGHEDCQLCSSGSTNYAWFFVPANCDLDDIHNPTNSLRVPYIGSTTDERSDIRIGHVRNPSKALKAAIRIATIYTWAYGDNDQCWNEAFLIAAQRANITLEDLKLITPISTSTNLAHRMRDRSTQIKYSSSSLNRVSRYTTISNDNLNFILEGSKTDTNYIYQQGMLLGLASIEDRFRFRQNTGDHNTVYHLHTVDECCVVKMVDYPNIFGIGECPIIQPPKNNRLIYDDSPIIERDQLKLDQQKYRVALIDYTLWTTHDLSQGLAQSLALTLIESITKSENDHLNEVKSVESDDDIKSLITEFLIVDPKLLCLHLGQAISINWSFEIHYRKPKGPYEMIDLLHKLLSRSSHGSFTILTNALSHPRIFKKFWDNNIIEPITGHLLDQQNLNLIAIEFMVECYRTYLHYWGAHKSNNLQYIICEPDEEAITTRYDLVQAKHLAMLNDYYNHSIFVPHIRGLDPLTKCKVLNDSLKQAAEMNPNSRDWNLNIINIIAYPASLTYIRRGTIKQLRMRIPNPMMALSSVTTPSLKREQQYSSLQSNHPVDDLELPIKINIKELLQGINEPRVSPTMTSASDAYSEYAHHIYRRIGINSSSCYKAVEICDYIRGHVNEKGPRLFLGEGAGAMLTTYYYLLGPSVSYYNTGVYSQSVRGQREFNPYPAEVALVYRQNCDNEHLSANVQVLFNGNPESTWIGNMDCFTYILNTVKLGSCSFIHCDLESTGDKTAMQALEELAHVISIAIAIGEPGSMFVLKLLPIQNDWSIELIRFLSENYDTCDLIAPWYSSPDSSEVYIICKGLIQSRILDPNLLYTRLHDRQPDVSGRLQEWILDKKGIYHANFRSDHAISPYTKLGQSNLNNWLSKLTSVEQSLITIGFQLNGPKLIRRLVSFDPGHDLTNLQSAIIMCYKELLYNYLGHIHDHHFFQPYPVLESSKIREIVYDLIRKTTLYKLLDRSLQLETFHTDFAQALSRKQILFSFVNRTDSFLCPHKVYNKLIKSSIQKNWIIDLSTPEVKMWWKIMGYTYLI